MLSVTSQSVIEGWAGGCSFNFRPASSSISYTTIFLYSKFRAFSDSLYYYLTVISVRTDGQRRHTNCKDAHTQNLTTTTVFCQQEPQIVTSSNQVSVRSSLRL